MHILILGSSGFLGSHITSHLLQQGHTVRAAVRGTAAGRPPQKGLAYAAWNGVDAAGLIPLLLDVDVLDAMIERVQKIRDQIAAKGTQGGKAYKLNAKDVQFMQQMQEDDTPVAPKAAKGKKDTQESLFPAPAGMNRAGRRTA